MTKRCIKEAINMIDFSDFPMDIKVTIDRDNLHIAVDNCLHRVTKKPHVITLTRPLIHTTDLSVAIKYIYWNVQEMVLHELAECFYVNNQRVFDPHIVDEVGDILGQKSIWVTHKTLSS